MGRVYEKLPKNQLKFANEFIRCGNASEAARKAGYSEKTAYSQGSRLLRNAKVARYIRQRMEDEEAKLIASADEVVKFYTAVMRNEVKDQFGLEASLDSRLEAAKELMKRHSAVEKDRPGDGGVQIVDDIPKGDGACG